jgi:hypothetical protein
MPNLTRSCADPARIATSFFNHVGCFSDIPQWRHAFLPCRYRGVPCVSRTGTGQAAGFGHARNPENDGGGLKCGQSRSRTNELPWEKTARNYASAFFPIMQKPLPKGSLQNAIGGRCPSSNFCSHFPPAFNTLTKTLSKSSTWKSI